MKYRYKNLPLRAYEVTFANNEDREQVQKMVFLGLSITDAADNAEKYCIDFPFFSTEPLEEIWDRYIERNPEGGPHLFVINIRGLGKIQNEGRPNPDHIDRNEFGPGPEEENENGLK